MGGHIGPEYALKYYRSFIPVADSSAISETMSGSSVAHLKFQLGLITSRFRANHPLKACPACMVDDQALYGWAYWHMEHQFPGVWWCHHHECLLHESFLKSTGVGRFLWHLPEGGALRQWPYDEDQSADAAEKAVAGLAGTTKGLVMAGAQAPFDTDRFWEIYRKELDRRGWLTNGQSLRMSEIAPAFVAYAARLRFLPELATLPNMKEAAASQLGRLFRQPRTGTHPVRHAVLIHWLFDGAEAFVEQYRRLNVSTSRPLPIASVDPSESDPITVEDTRAARLLQLLDEPGVTMRSAAKTLGVDIKTAMAWAAKAGLSTSRRPKVLKGPLREAMIKLLRAGRDKIEVADQMGISVSSVTRILRTEPGLQRKWHETRYARVQRNARTTWSKLVRRYPHLGTKLLRAQEPAVYAWLYRNDREWLKEHSPAALALPQDQAKGGVRWDKRDLALSAEVQRVTLDLSTASPGARIFLWQLYQQIPELRAKLDVLDRLPLTRDAIEHALRRHDTSRGGLF